jgi:heptosyltransferase-2
VVACPGPGEHAAVAAVLADAVILPSTDVGAFAALLAASRLVVANDSGPGHVAAAVGARLVSVFGVTEPTRTRPWGPGVTLVGSERGWPRYEEVLAAVEGALAAT